MGVQDTVRDRFAHIALRCAIKVHVWGKRGGLCSFLISLLISESDCDDLVSTDLVVIKLKYSLPRRRLLPR